MAERPGVSGDGGSRSTCSHYGRTDQTQIPLSDYPLFLGIGRKANRGTTLQARRAFAMQE